MPRFESCTWIAHSSLKHASLFHSTETYRHVNSKRDGKTRNCGKVAIQSAQNRKSSPSDAQRTINKTSRAKATTTLYPRSTRSRGRASLCANLNCAATGCANRLTQPARCLPRTPRVAAHVPVREWQGRGGAEGAHNRRHASRALALSHPT